MPITSLQYPTQYTDLNVYWHGIQVPYGYSASVYDDAAYTDLHDVYVPKLDIEGRMKCEYWGECSDLDACPLSAIVHRDPNAGAKAYWDRVGSSNEALTFEYSVGFTKSDSHETT